MCELCKYTEYEKSLLVEDAIKMGNAAHYLSAEKAVDAIHDMSTTLHGNSVKGMMCHVMSFYGYTGTKPEDLTKDVINEIWDNGRKMMLCIRVESILASILERFNG